MTVLITLTTAGSDSGPFNLYSNLDGYTSAFETGVSKNSLLAGYPSSLVPDYTNIIRVKSSGTCVNYIDIALTTTTTTSTSSTTTTTTTLAPSAYMYFRNFLEASGTGDSSTACAGGITNYSIYSTKSDISLITYSDILYSDPDMLLPFDGDSKYYGISSASGASPVIALGMSIGGFVFSNTSCVIE